MNIGILVFESVDTNQHKYKLSQNCAVYTEHTCNMIFSTSLVLSKDNVGL